MMHRNTDEAKDHALKIQKEIDDLSHKAQNSSVENREEYTSQIQELRQKKYDMLDEYHHLKYRGDQSDESVNIKAM
jgi:hypothetical protein